MGVTAQSFEAMPAFGTTLREDDLRVTDEARAALAGLLEQASEEDGVEAVRVYVAGGGCGGMTYGMTFTDISHASDRVLEHNGLKLCVDPVALGFLKGAEIDYVEQGMGASFVFRDAFQSVGGSGGCSACGSSGSSGGGCG